MARRVGPCGNLALAVQDGMTPETVLRWNLWNFSTVFVGGTTAWKWATVDTWRRFATDQGKRLHVGRCGTLERLRRASDAGADSVDSASWVRNMSWHIVRQFLGRPEQTVIEGVA